MTPPKPPTQNTLMPCPFCQCKIERIDETEELEPYSSYHYHEHPKNDCFLSGFEFYNDDEIKWNIRADLSPPCAEVVDRKHLTQKLCHELSKHIVGYQQVIKAAEEIADVLLEKNRVGG